MNDTAHHIKKTDPFHRLLTVHPGGWGKRYGDGGSGGFKPIPDMILIDFFMTQSGGHEEVKGIWPVVSSISTARKRYPDRPAMLGESLFEGMHGASKERIQRAMFWGCMLSGAAGHCYGADGIWQFNRQEAPFGKSPFGNTWGYATWQEAACWLGSKHIGIGKQLL